MSSAEAFQDYIAGVVPESDQPKKSNHQANIVRIDTILPHPDPDTTNLELIQLGGYQVVVRKGEFRIGDLGVYIQPDSVVPQTEPFRFIWGEHVGLDGKVPEKRRRITVRKFRGQWSEGLLLPVTAFDELVDSTLTRYLVRSDYPVGTDVSDTLGITHWNPDTTSDAESTTGKAARSPRRKFRLPRTFKGWFRFLWRFIISPTGTIRDVPFIIPTYDVEAYKNYKGTFKPGEWVVVTEKIHGSNARFIFLDGEMYAGSRNQWKDVGGDDIWNKVLKANPWIEQWCRKYPGFALYGEVTPTQKGFDYGAKEPQFFVFDVLTPEKKWMEYVEAALKLLDGADTSHYKEVPVLYYGPFDEGKISNLVDGASQVRGAKHIREGIVVKTVRERTHRGLGRAQLKLVSSEFLLKDSK